MATSSRSTHPPPPQPPQQPPPPPPPSHFLEITIISAKHLKNVNWKTGDLKPYAIFWVDPDHKLTTKSDDSGHTKPVWNQRFCLPITTSPLSDAFLSLEIFHSRTSETPKPFVGSLQVQLSYIPEPENGSRVRTYDVVRPSGRTQGRVKLKLAIKEELYDYQNTLNGNYYYSSAPPFPYDNSRSASPALQFPYGNSRSASPGPPSPYNYPVGYFPGYYPANGPGVGARSYGAPSAPGMFPRAGLGVGAVAGGVSGIVLDEGIKYEDERVAESVEENYLGTPKGDYGGFRRGF